MLLNLIEAHLTYHEGQRCIRGKVKVAVEVTVAHIAGGSGEGGRKPIQRRCHKNGYQTESKQLRHETKMLTKKIFNIKKQSVQ